MKKADFTPDAIYDELLDHTVNRHPPDDELSEIGWRVYITNLADIEVISVTKRGSYFIVKGSATLEVDTDLGEGDSWSDSYPMTFTYEFDEDGKIVTQLHRSIDTSSFFAGNDDEAYFIQRLGHRDLFEQSILKVNILLKEPVSPESKKSLHGMLYVNGVTALECYLSDFFVARIKEDKKLLRKLIETTPKFNEQKMTVSDVFGMMDSIEKKASSYLTGLVWHRLEQVRSLYEKVLGVTFPSIRDLQDAITVRHELVHRNGRKPDGTEHEVTEEDVRNLIRMEQELVEHIEREWTSKTTSTSPGIP